MSGGIARLASGPARAARLGSAGRLAGRASRAGRLAGRARPADQGKALGQLWSRLRPVLLAPRRVSVPCEHMIRALVPVNGRLALLLYNS